MIRASAIKPSIPSKFDDADKFLAFRYHDKLPMVGPRIGDTFHILWIEANYGDVYDHE